MNYNFTITEKDIIENSIGTLSQFSSLVSSYKELVNELTLTSFNLDETNFTSDEIVPGILVSIEEKEDGFVADMLIDGVRRNLRISNDYDYDLRRVQRSLFNSEDTNWTYEEIDTYEFLINKVFNVYITNSVIEIMDPANNPEMLFALVQKYYNE